MVFENDYVMRSIFMVVGFIIGRLTMAIQCDFFIPKKIRKKSHIWKSLFFRR